ncbi:MAG: MmcB family DNA repair protein [Pyrinomonadaceae bacterium]
MSEHDNERSLKRLNHLRTDVRPVRVGTLFDRYYRRLQLEYRNEYVFKNTLLHEQLLQKYKLSSTVVLDEFKIAASKADFILLNGEIRVFEVKTDLDNFDKLDKQIADYRRFASKIYLVVTERLADRVSQRLLQSSVGIIIYSDSGHLITKKVAEQDDSSLDHSVIFKVLRKAEYLELISKHFGRVPNVPNTRVFSECLTLARELPVITLQNDVRQILRRRNIRCPELLISKRTPTSLKHLCYRMNLTFSQYQDLFRILDTKQ